MFKDQFTVRLSNADLTELNEHYPLLIQDLDPPETMPRVFYHICKKALSMTEPKILHVSKSEDQARIKELELLINGDGTEENRGYLGLIESRESLIKSLESENESLIEANRLLTLQIEESGSQEPQIQYVQKDLGENQMIIEMPNDMIPFLKDMVAVTSQKEKRQVTIPELMLHVLWQQMKNGPGDWLPKRYSRRQIEEGLK